MRKWLAGKLFDWATSLDWDTTAERAILIASIEIGFLEAMAGAKKRGRPKGRKDGVGPKPEPKKRGRPAKSDNWRTHAWVPGEKPEPKKRGRPLGSKNKPKVVA